MSETARHFEAEPGLTITLHDQNGVEETVSFGKDGHYATTNPLHLGVIENYERIGLVKEVPARRRRAGRSSKAKAKKTSAKAKATTTAKATPEPASAPEGGSE